MAAVELAIILPIFLLVLFGIVEFGGMMYDQQIIETAAREGARWGAAQSISANHPISCSDPVIQQIMGGPNCSGTQNGNQTACSTASNFASSSVFSFQQSNQPNVMVSCDPSGPFLAVTVSYSFGGLGGLGGLDPVGGMTSLNATSSMYFE